MTSVDIVIVNWNSGPQLQAAISSIAKTDRDAIRLGKVLVVDNASTDASLQHLDSCGLPLKVLRNSVNLGFGAACNQGARQGSADYVLFLNPDARLFPQSLQIPLNFMEEETNRRVGICGIQLINEKGTISPSCSRFPSFRNLALHALGLPRLNPNLLRGPLMVEWDHRESRTVDQVMGAFFLVRRNLFERLNGFDERFFVYFEEVDFSLRAHALGFSSMFLATAQAFHKGGGTSDQIKALRHFYSVRSRLQYCEKHFPRASLGGVLAVTLLAEPTARLLNAAIARSPTQIVETIQAYKLIWSGFPGYLKPPGKPADIRS